ncbi:hypothetical protein [Bradyrhizobium sp. SZCCHNS3004]|uniref:hypothetical protein n=1 Tax=Bradyrhizobium sp. SZCCHNS3004 TaxID=3057312 RepID=UPI0029169F11|nr:hypothetical protein [Bradyrhizobium sp. SZCCHNS3004]
MKIDPHDPVVVRAKRIVIGSEEKKTAFARDVLRAMHDIGEAHADRASDPKRKHYKKAAGRLALAFRHVERIWTDKTLEFPFELQPNPWTLNELIKLAELCEEIETEPSGIVDRLAAEAKRDAVQHAARLMKKYDIPIDVSNEKESQFCKLAELLLNHRKSNLRSQCKAYIRELNGRKKSGAK